MKLWKLMLIVALVGISVGVLSGCANTATRHFGGNMDINLPAGQKLEMATWKENSLWYMTRPMKPGEQPEVHTFKEQSNHGVLEGTIVFKETK